DSYKVPGGTLRLTYKDDVVVGVATDSPFYTTSRGLGPGSALAVWATARAGHWDACVKGFKRRVGPRVVYFVTGSARKTVRNVVMIGAAFDDPCPAGR